MTALTSLQVSAVLSYIIAIAVPAVDAVFPVLPSETAISATSRGGAPVLTRQRAMRPPPGSAPGRNMRTPASSTSAPNT